MLNSSLQTAQSRLSSISFSLMSIVMRESILSFAAGGGPLSPISPSWLMNCVIMSSIPDKPKRPLNGVCVTKAFSPCGATKLFKFWTILPIESELVRIDIRRILGCCRL